MKSTTNDYEKLRQLCYINDCHISGTHNPQHTQLYICCDQYEAVAKRLLKEIIGFDGDRLERANKLLWAVTLHCTRNDYTSKGATKMMLAKIVCSEANKLGRRVDLPTFHEEEMLLWEKEGFDPHIKIASVEKEAKYRLAYR
jgi:hypothetical protein